MDIFEAIELEVRPKVQRFINSDFWPTYFHEAKWGWQLIKSKLDLLNYNASVLEIGAGPQFLSLKVAQNGFNLTSIEPASVGFNIMNQVGTEVKRFAGTKEIHYEFLEVTGENFSRPSSFEFAYSINVMEHVLDIERVLNNVTTSLLPGGSYYFVCPNYTFPYEPHFNSLTLINKKLTDLFLKKWAIKKSKNLNPNELWQSLNWINWRQLNKWAKKHPEYVIRFEKSALKLYVSRASTEKTFIQRHKKLAKVVNSSQKILGLVIEVVPPRFLPILEVTISKSTKIN